MHTGLRIGWLLYVFFLIALLTGCAGTDFVRPYVDAFELGKTTPAQIVAQMGEPKKKGIVKKNGTLIESITYVYASIGGEAADEGVTPSRVQVFFFHKGILVGREFQSSFKSDSSNFDETKIALLEEGKTTRADVIRVFGEPTGAYIAPVVEEGMREAIGYAYQAISGGPFSGMKMFRKVLRISFDENNVIAKVEFVSTDTD